MSSYCNEVILNKKTVTNMVWAINDFLEELAYLIKHTDNN
jgi:hypothetical protein